MAACCGCVLLGNEISGVEKRKILQDEYHVQMMQKIEGEDTYGATI